MAAFFKGFAYAARGLGRAVYSERNFRFHLCAAVYVVALSFFYKLTGIEYVMLCVIIGAVLALELVNTAIENIVDKLSPEENRVAGYIKDISAGAVLVFCAAAVVCAFLLFWDLQVFRYIGAWFLSRPVALVALVASVGLSIWFVLFFGKKVKK